MTYYKKLKEKYANSKWILRNLFCWRIFLNISKIAEKCSTSNVIKEQLNWRIMYVNLGAKVVVQSLRKLKTFLPVKFMTHRKTNKYPKLTNPHANDSRCSSSRLDGRDCRCLSHLPLFRTENQYSFYPQ